MRFESSTDNVGDFVPMLYLAVFFLMFACLRPTMRQIITCTSNEKGSIRQYCYDTSKAVVTCACQCCKDSDDPAVQNIPRILIISFAKLVLVNSTLVSTAYDLTQNSNSTASHSTLIPFLHATTCFSSFGSVVLLWVSMCAFHLIKPMDTLSLHRVCLWAFYLTTVTFCCVCATVVCIFNWSHKETVLKQHGVDFLLLPIFSIVSCALKFCMDPRLYLIMGAVRKSDIDKNFADMRAAATTIRGDARDIIHHHPRVYDGTDDGDAAAEADAAVSAPAA
jgi:hypothetical protein